MHRLTGMLILLLVLAFAGQGCLHYVEEPTPSGQVAVPQTVTPVPPPTPAAVSIATAAGPEQPAVKDDVDAQAFRDSYRKAGSPRIAIFLNRALSDDVREWKAYSRQVVSVSNSGTSTTKGNSTITKSSGGVAIGRQYYQEEPGRVDPGEGWMWRFEDGFLEPFLANGVRVVDRATIMRLAAASSAKQGSVHDPVSVKQIEIQALQDKADLFIEILIREDAAADLGYEFKATAKEVRTGIIKVNVTSREWSKQEGAVKTARATSEGYTFSTSGSEEGFPAVEVVASGLASTTLKSLERGW